ncbi:MAG: NAD(P)/FAD-dependent oxidoreductase, partial [bacterium]|nr:NAD(P)/FAD-dependent oxidoreductase [bacterium]
MERVDCIIVGAGVVGIAIARSLSQAGQDVIVLEKAQSIGTETSSRNSEVIHAGIYYPEGSDKAKLCLQGKEMLYNYCRENHVGHNQIGKLIVATQESQCARLEEIQKKGFQNGVEDLTLLDQKDLQEREPELQGVGALWSPSTGIIDSHAFMLSLQGQAESKGAIIAFECDFVSAHRQGEDFEIQVLSQGEPFSFKCGRLVNSAGLYASKVAEKIEGLSSQFVPKTYYCRGNYFSLSGKAPFKHLIYPVPDADGLGIHLTLDLSGRARFGPDVDWLDSEINYDVDVSRKERFVSSIETYWPRIRDYTLEPDYAGIRPKLAPFGEVPMDFLIQGPQDHKVKGLVNLYGIESPG